MKFFILLLAFCSFGQFIYADGDAGSAQKQAMQMQLQQLIQLDKQIENLEQQKAQLKGEMAEHLSF